MTDIKKDIPIPRGERATKYPFSDMEVGESVAYPNEDLNGKAYRAAKSCGDRHNKKFIARREGDGIRIWRQA